MNRKYTKFIALVCAAVLLCSCTTETKVFTTEEMYDGLIKVEFYRVEIVNFIDGYTAYVYEVLYELNEEEIETLINAISNSVFYYTYGARSTNGSGGFRFYYEDMSLDSTLALEYIDIKGIHHYGNWVGKIEDLITVYYQKYLFNSIV